MTPSVAYLLGDSARLLRRAFDLRVRAKGVTGPQARLLLVLGLHEGQNQGFYAEQLDVEAITLARAVRYHLEHRVFLNGLRTVVFR